MKLRITGWHPYPLWRKQIVGINKIKSNCQQDLLCALPEYRSTVIADKYKQIKSWIHLQHFH